MAVTSSRTEVEADMRETLGLVFSFFGRIPDELLDHEWENNFDQLGALPSP